MPRLALLIFCLTVWMGCSRAPETLPKELRKEIARLEREHRLAAEAAQAQGASTPPPLPKWKEADGADAIREQVQTALRELLEFRFALHSANASKPAPAQESLTFTADEPEENVVVIQPDPEQTQTVRIENVGSERLENPRVQVNAAGDWFDLDSLVASILPSGLSDREKAFALWKFVVANREHGRPVHPSTELHEPVRFLNVYGSGFCDDAAATLARLAEAAGLKARIWDLSGHVVPEIYFDDRWNLLDPDGEVCYFEDDGVTLANVEILQQNPERIRRFASPLYQDPSELIAIYGSRENNRISDHAERTRGNPHRMAYSLRPGESLELSRAPGPRYFSAGYFEEPPSHGSGRLRFSPVFRDELFRIDCDRAENLKARADHLETTAPTAEWVYRFALPYPMLDGRIHLAGEFPAGSQIQIALSEDGREWTHSAQFTPSGPHQWNCRLTPFFRNGYGDPVYQYFVRIRFTQPNGAAKISAAEFETDVQVAPRSLPKLVQGTNAVRFLQTGDCLAQVTFQMRK